MTARNLTRGLHFLAAAALLVSVRPAPASAAQVLIADRLSNAVYRYSGNGVLLGTVVADNVNLNQPSGIALSPDSTKLYVASSGNSQVVQYDYSVATGTATNPTVFGNAAEGLAFPSSILPSGDGSKVYVSNLGGTGVAQFNADGTLAGAPINGLVGGGAFFQFSGLAFAPTGELLVGGFQNFPAADAGTVAKSNAAITALGDFLTPSASLNGATGLLVDGDDLYVAAGFAGTVQRFDVNTGAVDPSFGLSGLAFPQTLLANSNGSGFLVSVLGFSNGTGTISKYGFDGTSAGIFASPGGGGFQEATALVAVVPEPATIGMLTCAAVALGFTVRRRRA
ncbi:SMP-30/gluconolactonase/LRE family protein [Lacipirellula limnantheis]|uniref:SMP-30/Gluconolaconase/LRE-like region n=1 Tax=Lacipirellula limnantheis TaxID=2528024 RepID=A0A517U2R6_9BACT|nr:SMP-30/gluconolactonase/LRE family protein [Lacipirellula limnantheis]QDT74914.1 SMP-30/Gluconolaconase/LRE-like region [Lacipirellula limnantheis]